VNKTFPFLLLALAGTAGAQSWQPLAGDAAGFFFDSNSVVVQADSRIGTAYRNIPNGQAAKSGTWTYLMNCTSREMTVIRIDAYAELDLKGKKFPELQNDAINRTMVARPNTPHDAFLKAACEIRQTARVGDPSSQAARPTATAPAAAPQAAAAPTPAPAAPPPAPAATAVAPPAGPPPLDGTKWSLYHSKCESTAAQGAAIAFRFNNLYIGEISKTLVAVRGKGKAVCTDGVLTGKSEESDYTIVAFEDGAVICRQYSDDSRLAVERVSRTLYKIMGDFSEFRGNALILKDCSIERR
jgi:hypothetical protein